MRESPKAHYKATVQARSPLPTATSQPASASPALRRYLFLTAAVCGAVVMVLEILGAKILTPYFGSSHFVWTAQIAVTLASLASGYALGGWWVDRSPSLNRIFTAVLTAALYIGLSLPFIDAISLACLRYPLPVGSLLAALALFFIPLALLAMVGPFLARVLLLWGGPAGSSIGRLSALSTLGSLIGTVLIGYILLPLAANSTTLAGAAAFLGMLCLIYFSVWGRAHATAAMLAFLTLLATSGAGMRIDHIRQFGDLKILARRNSNFGNMHVVETPGGIRYYLNDLLTQNSYAPEIKDSVSLFTYMLRGLAHAYTPSLKKVLCIGMGIGVVPMKLAEDGAQVEVVEINPDVVPLAKEFFDFKPDRVQLHIADGRQFLNQSTQRYDAIVLDAFLGDSSPSHLLTREAFTSIRRSLSDSGVLVINAFGSSEPDKDFMLASTEKTLRAVFQDVRLHASGNGNVFLVASPSPLKAHRPPGFDAMPNRIQAEARRAWEGLLQTNPAHGLVLTDDFNPVEFHDAKNREELRRMLASTLRHR